jgi:hypothetical protein
MSQLNIDRDIYLELCFSQSLRTNIVTRHYRFFTHSSLLFYSLTIFGLHYIQNCKSQIRQNTRSSLFCDVSRFDVFLKYPNFIRF